jgi:hypothetical protein
MGKSFQVVWTESREERELGSKGDWRTARNTFTLQGYVSEAGRVFGAYRLDSQSGTLSRQAIAASDANTSAKFNGRTLMLTGRGGMGSKAGGNAARQVVIDFDPEFSSCTARVMFARSSNDRATSEYNPFQKRMDEVRNSQTSSFQCSVQAGNVFGAR